MSPPQHEDFDWPVGGGELGALVRARDWATTPLGHRADWSPSLRAAVDLALGCGFPMTVLWGADLVQVYNDGYRALMGTKHPTGLGQATRECWPEVWHLNEPIYRRVLGGETVTLEDSRYPIIRHGHVADAYFTLCYSPLRDGVGAVAGILVTVFETTEAVNARTLEEARYRALFEATDLGFCVIEVLPDPRGGASDYRFLEVNRAFAAQTGLVNAVGETMRTLYPDNEERWFAIYDAVALTGEPARFEEHASAVGSWYEVSAFRVGSPEQRRVAVLFNNVTARRQAEVEREGLLAAERAARAGAEEAVQARDTFLSIAAHELKTPLTSLRGGAQLLARQQARGLLDPARLATGLDALVRATDRLAALIDDLMDVAHLRTRQLPLDPRPVDLVALARDAVAQARERAEGGPSLALDAPDDLPTVQADPARIEQVLVNLLDNATKYSPDGGAVRVAVATRDAGVAVAVRDAGIGLPPGMAEAIFEPFGRAANAAGHHPGMGLGLYICRRIVERHGGWIAAASAGEGRGTTVTFWLPLGGPDDGPDDDAAG